MLLFTRLSQLIEDWQYIVQQNGWQKAYPILSKEILSLPYCHLRFYLVTRPLGNLLPKIEPKIPLQIVPFKMEHLDIVRRIDRPSEAKSCALRLERAHIGLVALYEGEMVGYAWASREVDSELERVQITLQPDEALCVDVYTAPAFRRKGIQTALTLARFQRLQTLGFRHAVAYISVSNTPSLVVWDKVGAKIVREISFKRLGGWRRTRIKPAPPTLWSEKRK